MINTRSWIIASLFWHIAAPNIRRIRALNLTPLHFIILFRLRRLNLSLNILIFGLQEMQLFELENLVSENSILSVPPLRPYIPFRITNEFAIFPEEISAADLVVVWPIESRNWIEIEAIRLRVGEFLTVHPSDCRSVSPHRLWRL